MSRRSRTSRTTGAQTSPPAVELTLYVSAASPASARALGNARRILEQYDSSAVSLTVCDLSVTAAAAEREQIAFTPTLRLRSARSALSILGDLSAPASLIDLLEFHGVRPRHGHR